LDSETVYYFIIYFAIGTGHKDFINIAQIYDKAVNLEAL